MMIEKYLIVDFLLFEDAEYPMLYKKNLIDKMLDREYSLTL
jgi:hypothetical protein